MSTDANYFLIDWPEAVKRNTSPTALWDDITEAIGEAFDIDEVTCELKVVGPLPTWFRELHDGWNYNSYLWTAFAYEEIRPFLAAELREATDAFMLPNITSLGGYHRDLEAEPILVSLSPESVQKYLRLAAQLDLSKLRKPYDEHCPQDKKETLAE